MGGVPLVWKVAQPDGVGQRLALMWHTYKNTSTVEECFLCTNKQQEVLCYVTMYSSNDILREDYCQHSHTHTHTLGRYHGPLLSLKEKLLKGFISSVGAVFE